MNEIGKAIELIDGTESKLSYVVVQHNKAAILGIKPELRCNGYLLQFLLRVRVVADPNSTYGVEDRITYTDNLYPNLPFTKKSGKRSSYAITADMDLSIMHGFLQAENGELVFRRMVYKLMVSMLSKVQGDAGKIFDNMNVGLDYLTDQMVENLKKKETFCIPNPDSKPEEINLLGELDGLLSLDYMN